MTREYGFEKLRVWKIAVEFTSSIYKLTNDFPAHELYGIKSQIRRACVSIGCNLAEGTSRTSYKEQARFSSISYSSLMEVLNLLIISHQLNYLPENQYLKLRTQIEELSNGINALRNSQLNSSKTNSKHLNF
ncbi:MAG: four helix bundle protein [Cyclobacteriaceae bacterium]|nr:four helix bundle protein [Cyclobacteriaceae bacterium]